MVDGWGFSLGLGNRITRDYAVAERPISSKCYATSLRLVRGLVGVRCSARVCSYGHVTAGIVQRCESASLPIVLTAANMRAWPLPSRPFTRVAEQRRGALSRSLHALLRRLGPQANAAPARHLLQPHSRQRDAVAVPQRPARMYVDVPCRAGLAVCAAGFTCRRAARPALAALARWWCGINCLDVQLSRAARPTTTRETDRVGPPKLCPQSISLRCMIGHRCATVAFVALALARMPLQAHAGPSMSASASSRARSDSALAD